MGAGTGVAMTHLVLLAVLCLSPFTGRPFFKVGDPTTAEVAARAEAAAQLLQELRGPRATARTLGVEEYADTEAMAEMDRFVDEIIAMTEEG